jgi:putative DNA primase/helicase
VLCGSDARLQFIDAMRAAGIVPADHDAIIGDGGIHRFRVEGDKPGSRNGWCILHLDGLPAGVFGTWKGGTCGTWRAGRGPMTPAQRERFRVEIEQAKRQRAAEIAERHRQAQDRARRVWAEAAAPREDHPYLVRKGITPHGIRQLNGKLIVPMRDGDGVLWNVQTISGDGSKRFLYGGRKRGLYHAIGGAVTDELLIAEGYATAASLHETTGKPVAVAFDCGNLEPVARVLRAKFMAARITIAADNDTGTEGNPGITKATAAARAVGGLIAIPPEPFNDFNDAAAGAMP